ncbi:Nicotinamide riboside kinase [Erysiphe necator]|nr:Nicotinamide riboside kinase [Erysiphe necator]
MVEDDQNTIVVGISGASSSGKTTLSRLLMIIFPNLLVLHEDDFFKPENEIPYKGGFQNWDCVQALSIENIIKSLKNVRQNGTIHENKEIKKSSLQFTEDEKNNSKLLVCKDVIMRIKDKIETWSAPGQPGYSLRYKRICLFEGFLLYSRSTSEIWPYLDLKIFLQTSESFVKIHRKERSPYLTQEGFWEDPPDYVNSIVWPNYCTEHEWLFENGDVEGQLLEMPDSQCKILSLGGLDLDLENALIRIVDLLMEELPKFC